MRLFLSSDRTALKTYLFKNRIIKRGDSLALAVSGGADSVAMLLFFCEIKDEYGLKLTVKHFEHGIRGEESVSDMDFVKELSGSLKVPFLCSRGNVPEYAKKHGLSIEEAARNLRYEFLLEGDFDGVCLAHNFEDNAETVLFNMLRGSGIEGISGMEEMGERNGKRIIRPLLRVERKDIESYLSEKKIPFKVDSTNKDNSYTRNKIRNEIFPELKDINSRAVLHINQMAKDIRELKEYIERETLEMYYSARDDHYLYHDNFNEIPDFLAKTFIRRFLMECAGSLKDITRAHIDDIYNLAFRETGKSIDIPGGRVEKVYDSLAYKRKEPTRESGGPDISYKIRIFPYEKDMVIPKESYTKWVDYGKITSEFSLRFPEEGDFFTINSKGDRKNFNRFCIDTKIPRDERSRIPLFCRDRHIIWAVGYRISEHFKVTEDTKDIMEIKVEGS